MKPYVTALSGGTLLLVLFASFAVLADSPKHGPQNGPKNGFYAGASIGGLVHAIDDGDSSNSDLDGGTGFTGGVFGGYRHHILDGLFLGAEAFYSHIDVSEQFSNGNSVDIGGQYGIKAHLGYSIDAWSVYAIGGAAMLDYDIRQNGRRHEGNSLQPVLGLGAGYQLSDAWSVTTEFTGTGDDFGDDGGALGLYSGQIALRYHF